MSYENIIKKYKSGYRPGECRSKEYEEKIKQEKRLNLKLDLADGMFNDIHFSFTSDQKRHVKTLIKTFKNFKELHNKANNKEIITVFIFYVKSLETKENMIITPEGQLTIRALIPKIERQLSFPDKFEIISWKITLHYICNAPILPTEPEHIDHNILYKG